MSKQHRTEKMEQSTNVNKLGIITYRTDRRVFNPMNYAKRSANNNNNKNVTMCRLSEFAESLIFFLFTDRSNILL